MTRERIFAILALTLTMIFWGCGGVFVRSLALAGIIASSEPLIIALGAWLMLSEKLTPYALLGIGVAVAGSVALFWGDAGYSGEDYSLTGILLVFLSCVCWAIYTIASKPLLKTYGAYPVTAWTMIIAAPIIILNGADNAWGIAHTLTWRHWAEIFYLIIPYGVLGTLLWNYGAARLTGASTGAFLYLIPVIAVASGALILGEPVTLNIVLGGLLMLSGVAIAEFAPAFAAKRVS